jgi:hypothetical protein
LNLHHLVAWRENPPEALYFLRARGTRKTMIVALARKLLIALWRLVREGVVPDGAVLRPA